jgi:beta-N-acetylhexosaminidase
VRAIPPGRPALATRRGLVAAGLLVVLLGAAAACTSQPPPTTPDPGATSATVPSEASPAERAAVLAATLTDEELVGQVLMPDFGMSGDVAAAANAVAEFGFGGVILMGNVQNDASGTAGQVRAITESLQAAAPTVGGQPLPLLLATDQEYGWVTRIRDGVVQLPSAMAFGAADRPDLTEAAWSGAGEELAAVGINVDLAPDADVIAHPENYVIGSRSFGGEADVVADQVGAAVTGLQSAGVAATLKHFPGHGNTTVDSHTDLPVLDQSRDELEETDLAPFRSGVAAGAQLVMSGHLDVAAIDPGVPASFSSKVLVDVLRDELGFEGVIVTDALNMSPAMRWPVGEAAVRALLAGNDLLLMPPSVVEARDGLLDALSSGELTRDRLVESVTRILTLKFTLAANSRPDMSTVGSPAHAEAAADVAAAAVTVLAGACSGPLVTGPVRVTTSDGRDQQAAWLAEALTAAGVSVEPGAGTRIHLVGYGDGPADLASGAEVTVAMDTPYLLAAADSPVRIATYSTTRAAMQALAATLSGQASAPGHSPVPVAGLPASACAP